MACRKAGANVLVAGTYLYRAADMAGALAAMREPLPQAGNAGSPS